jgi:hypothetical protein
MGEGWGKGGNGMVCSRDGLMPAKQRNIEISGQKARKTYPWDPNTCWQ